MTDHRDDTIQGEDIAPLLTSVDMFIKRFQKKGFGPLEICAALANGILMAWERATPNTKLAIVSNMASFLGELSNRMQPVQEADVKLDLKDRN